MAEGREKAELEDLKTQSYFHGQLPRQVAERILVADGEFLLRYNDNDKNGGFVISVRHARLVRHFKITPKREGPGFWVRRDKSFRSVKELVEFYRRKRVSLRKDGPGEQPILIISVAGRDRWEIRSKDLELDSRAGHGAFGEVWKAKWRRPTSSKAGSASSTPEVAIKVCSSKEPKEKVKFQREAMFQLRFQHRNIVKVHGIVLADEPQMIVMEFMRNGSLRGYLLKHRGQTSLERLQTFVTDAARGLRYLESLKVIHRDVASRNCLVSASLDVKISDFGLAKGTDKYQMSMGKVAVKWMAPECMRDGAFTIKSDVWAFGILVWEIMSEGEEPYPNLSNAEVKTRVLHSNYRLSAPPKTPTLVAGLMRECWAAEPNARPSFAVILQRLSSATPSYSNSGGPTQPTNPSNPSRDSERSDPGADDDDDNNNNAAPADGSTFQDLPATSLYKG